MGAVINLVVFEEALSSTVANPVLAEVVSGLPGVGAAGAAPGLPVLVGVGACGPEPPIGTFRVFMRGSFVVCLYYWIMLGGIGVVLGGGRGVGVHRTIDIGSDDVVRGELT